MNSSKSFFFSPRKRCCYKLSGDTMNESITDTNVVHCTLSWCKILVKYFHPMKFSILEHASSRSAHKNVM